MARQGIFTGSSPNDGTGDSLVVGAVKVNQNFSEIYNTFGNGTNLISYVNNAGVATVAQGLSGTPNLNVGVVTATFFYGDGSNLTGVGGLGTESDPIFTSSVAFGISATNISNWNTAYGWGNHATVGYTTQGYITNALVGYATQGYVTNALVGYATQGYVTNALVGYATQGYVTTQIGLNTFTGAASTITSGQISNWNTAYSWGNHAAVGYVTSLTLNQLVDVNVGGPSTGQVLKWSGTEWEAASDLTASGGAGIGLSDLSVTITASGINSLTYNNTTGVFLFTPTSLVGYATQGYVTTQIGLNTFTGVASTITTTNISNWNTAYSWGNHASAGYLTNVNITAGSNITVLEVSEGNFIVTSTSIAGAGGTWTVNALGIHTTKNVGIGTTLSSSALTVEGDGNFTGVVTATRFQSTSAGTPTIDSPNNLNINAVTVAISTDVTVGRNLYAGINTSTGLILTSPNGSKYRLVVDNSGNLSTVLVP